MIKSAPMTKPKPRTKPSVDWPQLFLDLKLRGWSQILIADHLSKSGIVVGRSTLSDLSRGAYRDPAYSLGLALVELHREHVLMQPEAAEV